ncbi:MAG: hypothetical protein RJA09_2763 [Pseudomonadota bacterium]
MSVDRLSLSHARRFFAGTLLATLCVKLLVAATFPITGDEAFFYQWGVHPAWGYSDHPPMVGWWLAGLRWWGEHPLVLRSATLLVTSVVALGLVDLARRQLPAEQAAAAWWAGAVYLVLPWSWLFVLVTTDTPLVFWMAVSVWCFVRAEWSPRRYLAWYTAAGVALGLAFLSKYFAALLGLAYAVYVLGWRRDRWWVVLWVFCCALPSIALTLVFNAHNGWMNIMFNFFNRNEGTHWQWETFATYLLMVGYLLTPWLVWQAWRGRPVGGGTPLGALRVVLWAFPLLVFALLSWRRSIGLHWVLGFVPLFVWWASARVGVAQWRRSWWWTVGLSVPHVALVAALAWVPLSWWSGSTWYEKAVFLRASDQVTLALTQDMAPGQRLMAYAYSPAAVLAYHHGRYVPVFGVARHHARQDDLLVDFREWDRASVRVLVRGEPVLADFEPYFDRVRVGFVEVAGVRYHHVDGQGFRFGVYRERVLAQAAAQFHAVPAWLPMWGSPFCERYGFEACGPNR